MTVKTKSQVKAGRKVKLATWLSMSGALATVLFGAPVMVAQDKSESSGRTAPVSLAQAPAPGGDTQGPNSAPDLQQGTPDPGSTETPAPMQMEPSTPDTNVDPSTPEADTQGPNSAPDLQQGTPAPMQMEPSTPVDPSTPGDGTQGPNAAPDLQDAAPDAGSPEAPPSESSDPESVQAREENIVFVRTAEGASTGEITDQSARFNQIVGSGRLLVNGDDQVTGYYFTVSGLPQSQTLPYHFHDAKNEGTSTSCEGDKGVLEDEAAGAVITPLNDIAPLQSTAGGIAIVGTASNPIQLPNPVPLANIGYLNIHADPSVESGIVCANVPLQSIAFGSSETPDSDSESASPESDTQGPNAAPELQQGTPDPGSTETPAPMQMEPSTPTQTEPSTPDTDVDPSTPEADEPQSPGPAAPGSGTQGPNSAPELQQGTPDPGSTEPSTPDTNVDPSTPEADEPESPGPAGNPTSQPDNPPTQGPNDAPQTN